MLSKIKIILSCLLILILTSCIKLKGDFAYKTDYMDHYKKFEDGKEFNSNEKISWIYKIEKVNKKRFIGVVLLKKDLVWVDIDKYIYTIDLLKPNVYGSFKDLKSGEYKIVLMEKKEFIDSIHFQIYRDSN